MTRLQVAWCEHMLMVSSLHSFMCKPSYGAAGQTMGRTIDNCRCQTKHSHIGKTLTIQAIYMTSIPTCTHEETYAAQSMFVQRMQACCQLQCTCFAYRMLAFTYALSHFAITKQNHGEHICLADRFPICNKRIAFKPLVWHKPFLYKIQCVYIWILPKRKNVSRSLCRDVPLTNF